MNNPSQRQVGFAVNFREEQIMNHTRAGQDLNFKWGAVALITVAVVTALGGSFSQAQQEKGAGSPVAAATDSRHVMIDNFAYSPVPLTVKVGDTVTWTNHDDIPHTVDSTQGRFKSAALDTDDKFEFRFTEPGEYPFYCRIHPKMTGKIVVQP
jgi:plastocyanin